MSRWNENNSIKKLMQIIGEDHLFMNELQVEIIPKSCVSESLRSILCKIN